MIKMLKENRSLRYLFIIGVTVLAGSSILTIDYLREKVAHHGEARQFAEAIIKMAASEIDGDLKPVPVLVEKLVDLMNQGGVSRAKLRGMLRRSFYAYKNLLLEVGVGFEPKDKDAAGDAPHYGLKDGRYKFFQVEDSYPYLTDPDRPWYRDTVKKGEGHWIEPYFGGATKQLVIGYSAPFYIDNSKGEKIFGGVCRANISLDKARAFLLEQPLGRTGYGFLVTKKGTVIAHPKSSETLKNVAHLDVGEVLLERLEKEKNKTSETGKEQAGIFSWQDPNTNQDIWVLYHEIPTTGWLLVAKVIQGELMQQAIESHQWKEGIIINAWVLFALLFVLFSGNFYRVRHNKSVEWQIAIACSLVLVAGIGVLWNNIGKSYLFKSSATLGETRHIKRQVDAAYNAKIKGIGEINGEMGEEEDEESTSLIYVPTGVFIQSLEFSSANNVTMTGYIWQKYDLEKTGKRSVDKQGGFKQGVIFPEAVSGDIEEVYRIKNKQKKEELVGWYFEMVLRQPFEFRLYPFDHKNVWLRIWAADFEKQVVLIPDIDSYPFINPLKLPGVEWKENFVLNGWTLVNSYFEYKRTPYNSTFGMETDPKGEHIPELYFTINLERNFIDAFITNLVPLIVVLFMLLATLMMVTRNPDKANTFGANPFAILGACSALFFVVLIAHIQLRTQFAVPEIMYLEYFYFVMYVAILTVTVCAFLIISDVKSKLMHLKDGLLPKVLFLPAILLMIYVITFVVFY